ncbi:unnamed protein product [Enterobius vermicularis]|uniref:Choline transporter-like protein n=1 Tax=Enterobius vermicularis TaxID=51028 RepID=A0A0N4VC75_ENTVE|nr:unnamed protein product [Enterobius vermicularis]
MCCGCCCDADKIAIAVYGALEGDSYQIIRGIDSWGNICGKDNRHRNTESSQYAVDMSEKLYVMPVYSKVLLRSAWICVESCLDVASEGTLAFHNATNYRYCFLPPGTSERICATGFILPSRGLFSSRCIPDYFVDSTSNVPEEQDSESEYGTFFDEIFVEFEKATDVTLFLCCFAFVFCIATLFIVGFLASLIIYFFLAAIVTLGIGVSVMFWVKFVSLKLDRTGYSNQTVLNAELHGTVMSVRSETMLIFAIASTVITVRSAKESEVSDCKKPIHRGLQAVHRQPPTLDFILFVFWICLGNSIYFCLSPNDSSRLKEKSDLASSFFYNIVVKTLRAIEQCVRVINHNAYIMIVIKGKNFCPAAKLALEILMDRAFDFATVNIIGDLTLYVIKFLVTLAVFFIALVEFKVRLGLESWIFWSIFVASFTYFVASCFLNLIEMIVDTLFLAFAQDEQTVGSDGKLCYYNPEFASFIDSVKSVDKGEGKYSENDEVFVSSNE